MSLILPDSVRAELENEARARVVDSELGKSLAFYHHLKDRYPDCDLVFASADPGDEALLPAGVLCARWHIVKRNPPPAAHTYIPIVTEDGGYREPTAHDIELLKERDMRLTGGVQGLLDRERKEQEERDRAAALLREQQRDELAANYKTALRVPENALEKNLKRWGRGSDRRRP